MTVVYLAGPYSDAPQSRVLDAAHVTKSLMKRGYIVYSPHLHWHWFNNIHPSGYEDYMTQCLGMLRKCDVLIRLPGVSPGSDREVALARELGIPVFLGLEAFEAWEET